MKNQNFAYGNSLSEGHNEPPVALAGFFSWLKRAVTNVVRAVAKVSHDPFFAINIIEDAFDGNGFTIGIKSSGINLNQNLNLTAQDEVKLDNWVNNNFLPFYKQYFIKIKEYNLNPPTVKVFKAFFDEAMEFIALIDWYRDFVKFNGETYLSSDAINARNQFLDIQMRVLEKEINKYISSTNVNLNQTTKNQVIDPEKYSSLLFNLPSNTTISVVQQSESTENVVMVSNDPPVLEENKKKSNGAGLFFLALIGLSFILSLNSKKEVPEESNAD
ncbi:MAG: hypothetical protein R2816_06780 [Flavobacteriaceae bacterium]|nr:hypothetical protein [Flavobacteriaceae bacterium]